MPSLPEDIIPLKSYLPEVPGPMVIAGPCSAESEEQVLETARQLAAVPQVAAFRCGLWKPRTRPGDFEGVGDAGLKWLQQARTETGLKIAVEVAMPAHVNACLKAGVDILWIGSRTVVNPFSVNEIAEVLKGIDIPVLVKNPVNPDLRLWIGALERLHHQGIRKLAGVHRGFSAYESRPYRNLPLWHIPLELHRLWPDLPVLTDPSHIAGKGSLVPEILQVSTSLGFDGLMIESHYKPDSALTDRHQQITPATLADILAVLNEPDKDPHSGDSRIKYLRLEIDQVDEEIIRLLARRLETAAGIGEVKRLLGLELIQPERWKEVVADRLQRGAELGLRRNFLLKILQEIHEESIRKQGGGL